MLKKILRWAFFFIVGFWILLVVCPSITSTMIRLIPGLDKILFGIAMVLLSLTPINVIYETRGVKFGGSLSNSTVLKCLYALGDYEPSLADYLESYIRPEDVFVDVGANEGFFAVLMATKVKRVYAVEPDTNNLTLLENNVKLNDLQNVKILPIAAGKESSEITLYSCRSNRMWSSTSRPNQILCNGIDEQRVPVEPLDKIIPEIPNVVKIDAENYEKEVLQGMKDWIGKTRIFIVETDSMEIVRNFENAGYKAEKLNVDSIALKGTYQMPQPIGTTLDFSNVIFTLQ